MDETQYRLIGTLNDSNTYIVERLSDGKPGWYFPWLEEPECFWAFVDYLEAY